MPTITPTGEQQDALAMFATGDSLVIEAGAGTGKTSTLRLLAESAPSRQGQYVAFNRAIVVEAQEKMPRNVTASTAHSLAFKAVGHRYKNRLNSRRQSGPQIAQRLGVDPIAVNVGGIERKVLAAGFLASHVMLAIRNFCHSTDPEPGEHHVGYIEGIDMPTDDGRRTYDNNRQVRRALVPYMRKAWDDICSPTGSLRFEHDYYLKMWQLADPLIGADFIMFDEAQDADPVMADIIACQTHAQRVYVGDSQQAIYEWRGAVNAIATFETDQRAFLTQSFRFGQAVADVANRILSMIADAELRLSGTPTIDSMVIPVEQPRAVLCRTNAGAVEAVLDAQREGRAVHLVGGGYEVVRFAKAAALLQQGAPTDHPELACFSSWGAVQEYVATDPQGSDLRLMVGLVDKYGVPTILRALDREIPEAAADVIVSTAHKAKGREWTSVRLSGDFPTPQKGQEVSDGELRLLYVACTRAQNELDLSALPWLTDDPPAAEPEAVDVIGALLAAPLGTPSCCLHGDDRHGVGVCCLHPADCPAEV